MSRIDPARDRSRYGVILACVLVTAIVAAYAQTLRVPFHFDDFEAILHNATIRHLWPLRDALAPPHHLGSTVGGRPLLNLSFALNYAISGEAVWSYHVLNLAIHLGCALLLAWTCRQTLLAAGRRSTTEVTAGAKPSAGQSNKVNAALLSFAIAAVWALHPLQTEAVTYLSQRAESLASFFYLLTVYAFSQAAAPPATVGAAGRMPASASRWLAVSGLACLLGVATKEIVATAPITVLLLDRTFYSGSFRAAWRRRRAYYVALVASWLLVAALAISTQNRGGTAGFGTGVTVWAYLLTQAHAIARYLRLVFWPTGLVFDYGTGLAGGLAEVWPFGLLVITLLIASMVLLIRDQRRGRAATVGFLGLTFFLLLAPSSSFVPVGSQTMAEHRMYLPLACIAILLGVAAWHSLRRRCLLLLAPLAMAEGILTHQRNEVYRSDLALWSDTVAQVPENARAQNNLGDALVGPGRFADALPHYAAAVKLQPDYVDAQSNLGHVLVMLQRPVEALPHAELAVKLNPESADVWTNYGLVLSRLDRLDEAIRAFEHALRLSPRAIDARYDLGNTYYQLGEYATAISHYDQALQLQPDRHDARFNKAYALLRLNRPLDALREFEQLLRQDPSDAGAHVEVANILAHIGRSEEAIPHLETALQLKPDFTPARQLLDQIRGTPSAPVR